MATANVNATISDPSSVDLCQEKSIQIKLRFHHTKFGVSLADVHPAFMIHIAYAIVIYNCQFRPRTELKIALYLKTLFVLLL